MAVVKGPLFSMDASGKVGGALVFSKWKGRNYVRRLVIPSNPRSGAQVGRRAMLSFIAKAWNAVSVADKATWQVLADILVASPFNAYTSENGRYWHNFKSPSMSYARAETGVPSDNALTAAVWEENRVKLTFSGAALGDAWGKVIFGAPGATVTTTVGTTVLVAIDYTIAAHDIYWTPHYGDIPAQWTFNSMTFSDDGVLAAAGGAQTTP